MKDKQAIIDSLVKVITSVPKEVDYDRLRSRVQEEMDEIEKKKESKDLSQKSRSHTEHPPSL